MTGLNVRFDIGYAAMPRGCTYVHVITEHIGTLVDTRRNVIMILERL